MTDDTSPEPAPEPAPPDAPPVAAPRPDRRVRILLAVAAVLGIAAVVVFVAGRRAGGGRGGAAVTDDRGGGGGGGAPDRPRLPGGQPGTGSERLAGTVVDASGTPVAGVSITAELELGPGDRSPAPAPGVAAAAAVIAQAGDDGTFLLEGMVPGRHRLRVEGADIFTAELRFVAVPSDGLRIAVARRVDLVGVVVDTGRPVPGAVVTIDGDALGGRLTATCDGDGAFAFDELPEGNYRVWAHESDLAARAIRVPRLGAGPFAPVTLTLEPATIVVGRVVDRATGLGIEAAVSLEAGDGHNEAARYGRSDQNGVFRIEGVPHGRWLIDGWAPGWVSTGALDIEAGRGIPELELAAGAIVEGRVVDGKGRPVVGAVVSAVGEGAMARMVEASGDMDADRLRRFSGFAPVGTAAGPAAAVASSGVPGDFTSDPRFVPRGELGVLLGPLPYPPPPGASRVRQATIVDGQSPSPSTGTGTGTHAGSTAISAGEPSPLRAEPAYQPVLVTDGEGRFRITGLEAATWWIVASAPAMATGKSKRLPLGIGKVVTGVEVVLGPGTFLVGTVRSDGGAPVVGATVTALPAGARGDRDRLVAVSDSDGRYRLGPLVGEVAVAASAYGHGEARADLTLPPAAGDFPDEQARDFVLAQADARLRGRIVDGDQLPVRGAEIVVDSGAARGRRADSDATGWFEIVAVPAGDARVIVEHADFPAQGFAIDSRGDATLVLRWGAAIEGVVFDHHTGEPLAGIPVVVTGAGSKIEVATGARGELLAGPLLPGPYTVRIEVAGYLMVERAVEVGAAREVGAVAVRDVRLELERGALLAGVVRDRYGNRLPSARVVVERAGGGLVEGKTDSDGEFRLRDVPTGEVTVRAEKGALGGSKGITLRPGDEVLSFTLDLR